MINISCWVMGCNTLQEKRYPPPFTRMSSYMPLIGHANGHRDLYLWSPGDKANNLLFRHSGAII